MRKTFLGLAAALAVLTVIFAGLMPAVARASDGGGGNNCGNWGGQGNGLRQFGGNDCQGGGGNNCGNWGGQGNGLRQFGGNDCQGGGGNNCGNWGDWGGQGDGLLRSGGNDCWGGGHHHCGNWGDWGGKGDALRQNGGRPDCDPQSVPAAVVVAPTHNMYVCYSKWQVEPMAVSMDEGKALIATGYWMPWAIKNGTTATTIGNNYHLQCNLSPTQAQGTLAVGGGGEEFSGVQAQNLFASNPDDFYHDAG